MYNSNAEDNDDTDATATENTMGSQLLVQKEFVFKIVVVGDYSVGKTTFIQRLLQVPLPSSAASGESVQPTPAPNAEIPVVSPTVGTDFYSRLIPSILPGVAVRLQLWDTAGLEKYSAQYSNTYRNASFVICVFDVTRSCSLHSLLDHHLTRAADHIPDLEQCNILVVGNKTDLLGSDEAAVSRLKRARHRSRSPEAAFLKEDSTRDDLVADDVSASLQSSAVAEEDGVVTAAAVLSDLLSVFGDVHYAEVSALTMAGMAAVLEQLCFAVLRNAPKGGLDVPPATSCVEALRHTVLPSGGSPAFSVATSASGASQQGGSRPRSTSSIEPPDSTTMKGGLAAFGKDAKVTPIVSPGAGGNTGGSWMNSGLYSFDMQRHSEVSSTAVFSPMDGELDDITSGTRRPPGSGGAPAVVGAESIHIQLSEKELPHGVKNDAMTKRQREQEEMKALLSRAAQRQGGDGATATGDLKAMQPSGTATCLRNDADVLEGMTEEGDGNALPHADSQNVRESGGTGGSPRPSILDEAARKYNAAQVAAAGDDDEDGVILQQRIQDRFQQIEQDAKEKREADKAAKKKKSKAKGKCKMCTAM